MQYELCEYNRDRKVIAVGKYNEIYQALVAWYEDLGEGRYDPYYPSTEADLIEQIESDPDGEAGGAPRESPTGDTEYIIRKANQ